MDLAGHDQLADVARDLVRQRPASSTVAHRDRADGHPATSLLAEHGVRDRTQYDGGACVPIRPVRRGSGRDGGSERLTVTGMPYISWIIHVR